MDSKSNNNNGAVTIDSLIEELEQDKYHNAARGDARIRNAQELCKTIPDFRTRVSLINILMQSLVEDDNVETKYRTLPGRYFAGAQKYWENRMSEYTLLTLPMNVFLSDEQLSEYYLDEILPGEALENVRTNIAQCLRMADYLMYVLTQYTQYKLRNYMIRCAVTELGATIEGILVAFATNFGDVPLHPCNIDFSKEELTVLESKDFEWTYNPEEKYDELHYTKGHPISNRNLVDLRHLTIGSFTETRKAYQLNKLQRNSVISEYSDPDEIRKALSNTRTIKLIAFNKNLFGYGDQVLNTEVHFDRSGEEIKSYESWLNEVVGLRHNVHLAAVEGTFEEDSDYQTLETVSWVYAFLHVTVEALRLYMKEEIT